MKSLLTPQGLWLILLVVTDFDSAILRLSHVHSPFGSLRFCRNSKNSVVFLQQTPDGLTQCWKWTVCINAPVSLTVIAFSVPLDFSVRERNYMACVWHDLNLFAWPIPKKAPKKTWAGTWKQMVSNEMVINKSSFEMSCVKESQLIVDRDVARRESAIRFEYSWGNKLLAHNQLRLSLLISCNNSIEMRQREEPRVGHSNFHTKWESLRSARRGLARKASSSHT